ncbi:recombinase family protein [Streptomyces sp. NPDC051173]|uniref:recombinase family protein n=1 Tax=Streptomyces sp. NPDC051173 TaxID=3155164 RepID=UPI00344EA204
MPIAPEYLHLVYPGLFPAFLYGRNSHDPSKKGASVDTQVDFGRELCERFRWPIVGVFNKDVDRSASRHARRQRDDFEAMLEGIRDGKCRIVVAWEASRYYRALDEYVRLRKACQEGGVLLCYNGTIYDLSKREDIKATARDALDAEDEVEGIRDRNLRTQRKLAEDGRPAGRTPYGYMRRYDPETGELVDQVPHPVRSRFVVQIFKRFAAGQTAYRIAKWLNANPKAVTPSGATWDGGAVVEQLRMRVYIGERVHRGVVVPGKASWKPIIDDELFHQVQNILDDPKRRRNYDVKAKNLLAFLAYCGAHPDLGREAEKGGDAHASKDVQSVPARRKRKKAKEHIPPFLIAGKRNDRRTYYCSAKADTAIRADVLEAYVEEAVLEWLGTDAAASAFRRDDQGEEAQEARNRLARLRAQLEEAQKLAGEFGSDGKPKLSILSLAALEGRLQPQIDDALQEVDDLVSPMTPLLRRLVGRPDREKVWAGLLLEQQREVLRQVVTVRLNRAHVKGAQKLMPGRISLSFVGQPGFKGD